MVTMGVFPFQGKTHMVEPGIEPGTSWLVVRSCDHQATRLVYSSRCLLMYLGESVIHLLQFYNRLSVINYTSRVFQTAA